MQSAADRPGLMIIQLFHRCSGYTLYFETFHGDVAYGGTRKFLVNTRITKAVKINPMNTEYGYWEIILESLEPTRIWNLQQLIKTEQ